jgi:hypothetical protein
VSHSAQADPPVKPNNLVRVRVTIRGTRPLWQHAFGPDAIPLEKAERTGVAGNDPEEWRRTMLVTPEGQLYVRGDYVFGCVRDGAKYTKKGKGSIQPLVSATLQIEEEIVLLDRWLPKKGDPPHGPFADVYVDVRGVRNPNTKSRNVRYRLAASRGWTLTFTIAFDRTIVAREVMRAVLTDCGNLTGIADGRSIGTGRFEVVKWEELTDAEASSVEGAVEEDSPDRVGKGRKRVRPVQEAAGANGGAR